MPKRNPEKMSADLAGEINVLSYGNNLFAEIKAENGEVSKLINGLNSFTDCSAEEIEKFLNHFLSLYKHHHAEFLKNSNAFVFDAKNTVHLFNHLYLFELVLSSLFFIAKRDSEGLFVSEKYKKVVEKFTEDYRNAKKACHAAVRNKFSNENNIEEQIEFEFLNKLNLHFAFEAFLTIIGVLTFTLGNSKFAYNKIHKKINLNFMIDIITHQSNPANLNVIEAFLSHCNDAKSDCIMANKNDLLSLFNIIGYERFTTNNQNVLDLLLALITKDHYLFEPEILLSSETLKTLSDPVVPKATKTKLLTTLLFDHFILYTDSPNALQTIDEFYLHNRECSPILVDGYLLKKGDHYEPLENFLLSFQSREILFKVLTHTRLQVQDLSTIYAKPDAFISIMNKLAEYEYDAADNTYKINRKWQIQFVDYLASNYWEFCWRLNPLVQMLEDRDLLKMVVQRLLLAFRYKFATYYSETDLIYAFEFFKSYDYYPREDKNILEELEQSFKDRTTYNNPSWDAKLSELYSLNGGDFLDRAEEIKSGLVSNTFLKKVLSQDRMKTILSHPLGKALIIHALHGKVASDGLWTDPFLLAYAERRLSRLKDQTISYSDVIDILKEVNSDFETYIDEPDLVSPNYLWSLRRMALAALKTFIENKMKNPLSHIALNRLLEITENLRLFFKKITVSSSSLIAQEVKEIREEFEKILLNIPKQSLKHSTEALGLEYTKQVLAYVEELDPDLNFDQHIKDWLIEAKRTIGKAVFSKKYFFIFGYLQAAYMNLYQQLESDLCKQHTSGERHFSDVGVLKINQLYFLNKVLNEFLDSIDWNTDRSATVELMLCSLVKGQRSSGAKLREVFTSVWGNILKKNQDSILVQLKDEKICMLLGVYYIDPVNSKKCHIDLTALNSVLNMIICPEDRDEIYQVVTKRDQFSLGSYDQNDLLQLINLVSFNIVNDGKLSESDKVLDAFIVSAKKKRNILGHSIYMDEYDNFQDENLFPIANWHHFIILILISKISSEDRLNEFLDNFNRIEIEDSILHRQERLSVVYFGEIFLDSDPFFKLFKSPNILLTVLKRIDFKLTDFTDYPSLLIDILQNIGQQNNLEIQEFMDKILDLEPNSAWYEKMMEILVKRKATDCKPILIKTMMKHAKIDFEALQLAHTEEERLELLYDLNSNLKIIHEYNSLYSSSFASAMFQENFGPHYPNHFQGYIISKGYILNETENCKLTWQQLRLVSLLYSSSQKDWMIKQLRTLNIKGDEDFYFTAILTTECLDYLEKDENFNHILEPLFYDNSLDKENRFIRRLLLSKLEDSLKNVATMDLTCAKRFLIAVDNDFKKVKCYGNDKYFSLHRKIYLKSIELVKLVFAKSYDDLTCQDELISFILEMKKLTIFRFKLHLPFSLWSKSTMSSEPILEIEKLLTKLQSRKEKSSGIVATVLSEQQFDNNYLDL